MVSNVSNSPALDHRVEPAGAHHLDLSLTHPEFPLHRLRVVSPKICDSGVKQYSGYLDISETKHLFFWFEESRSKPKDDPLVLWLNGALGSPWKGLMLLTCRRPRMLIYHRPLVRARWLYDRERGPERDSEQALLEQCCQCAVPRPACWRRVQLQRLWGCQQQPSGSRGRLCVLNSFHLSGERAHQLE